MKYVELVDELALRLKMNRDKARQVVEELTDLISSALRTDGKVRVLNLGLFERRKRKHVAGYAPLAEREMQITVVTFKPSEALKEAAKK